MVRSPMSKVGRNIFRCDIPSTNNPKIRGDIHRTGPEGRAEPLLLRSELQVEFRKHGFDFTAVRHDETIIVFFDRHMQIAELECRGDPLVVISRANYQNLSGQQIHNQRPAIRPMPKHIAMLKCLPQAQKEAHFRAIAGAFAGEAPLAFQPGEIQPVDLGRLKFEARIGDVRDGRLDEHGYH